jgi:hypothetical protein
VLGTALVVAGAVAALRLGAEQVLRPVSARSEQLRPMNSPRSTFAGGSHRHHAPVPVSPTQFLGSVDRQEPIGYHALVTGAAPGDGTGRCAAHGF